MESLGLLVIGSCIFLLAIVNMYLVWRLIKGVRFEDEKLDNIAAYNQQILSQQLSMRQIVSDPGFLALLRSIAPAPAAGPAGGAELDPALAQGVKTVSDAALGMGDLLSGLNDVKEGDLAAWKIANQARIDELLRTQNTMREEVELLEAMLAKANATVLNQRAQAKQAEPAAGVSAKEVETLKAAIAARDSKIAAAEAVLKNEKLKFDEEKKKLQEKMAEMQASFDRTLVEKSFIEEAFIEETAAKDKPAA